MEKMIDFQIPADEAAAIQTQFRACVTEMERANERIKKDQQEIERLKLKTRATLAEIAAIEAL